MEWSYTQEPYNSNCANQCSPQLLSYINMKSNIPNLLEHMNNSYKKSTKVFWMHPIMSASIVTVFYLKLKTSYLLVCCCCCCVLNPPNPSPVPKPVPKPVLVPVVVPKPVPNPKPLFWVPPKSPLNEKLELRKLKKKTKNDLYFIYFYKWLKMASYQ